MRKSLLIVGVGGQGTLLTGRLLGAMAMKKGLDVKLSEVHGMAQRGGSVTMSVKIGDKIYSPLIEWGEADVIFGFETLEALRYLPYLKEGGMMIVNRQQIMPMSVTMEQEKYPEKIEEEIKRSCPKAFFIDALSMAQAIGSIKCTNMVMLGAYVAWAKDSLEDFKQIVTEKVPPKTVAWNVMALQEGYKAYLKIS